MPALCLVALCKGCCTGGWPCPPTIHESPECDTARVGVSSANSFLCVMLLLLLLLVQFDAHQKTALVMYPETHEEEWINLTELVRDKCIAVGECVCVCGGGCCAGEQHMQEVIPCVYVWLWRWLCLLHTLYGLWGLGCRRCCQQPWAVNTLCLSVFLCWSGRKFPAMHVWVCPPV